MPAAPESPDALAAGALEEADSLAWLAAELMADDTELMPLLTLDAMLETPLAALDSAAEAAEVALSPVDIESDMDAAADEQVLLIAVE